MVRLTRIYTKTGDAGQTHLGDMSRVAKTDPRLVAYADVDESNTVLGVAVALGGLSEPTSRTWCASIQNDLFDVGADLCTPITPDPEFPPLRITPAYTERLEAACDAHNEALANLTSFILPGGTAGAALLHQARVVVRRAERSVWALLAVDAERTQPGDRPLPQPAVGPAVHPGPGGQPGRGRAVAAGRRTAAPTHRARRVVGQRLQRTGGADSTQERKPVTVERSIASSRGPSLVVHSRTTTSEGSARSSRAGDRRDSTPSSARQSRSWGRTDSDRPRYQSSMSPPYQATPTDQRGEPTGRSHMVTAPRPESRNRRRSRKPPRRAPRGRDEHDEQHRGHGRRGPAVGSAAVGASGALAGCTQPRLGATGGVECLGVVSVVLGAAQRLTGRARRRSRWRSPRSRRGWTPRAR